MTLCKILNDRYEEDTPLLGLCLPRFNVICINGNNREQYHDKPITGYSILLNFNNDEPEEVKKGLFVDYVDATKYSNYREVAEIANNLYDNFHKKIHKEESVIVWDLDETIISKDGDLLFKGIEDYNEYFDKSVLWSHGSSAHVSKYVHKYKLKFDLYITRSYNTEYGDNKGMGLVLRRLNEKYNTCRISLSCLVDDTSSNFENDYTFFIKVDKDIKDYRKYYNYKFLQLEKFKDIYVYSKTLKNRII